VSHVPDWFPGAGWKAKAKGFADSLTDMTDIPHQFVKDQMVSCGSCQKGSVSSIVLHPYPPGWWTTLLGSYRCIMMSENINVRSRRLLERLFHRSRPNCLTAKRSRRRPKLTSNGRLLRYMQVRLTALQTDEVRRMLTDRVCCSFSPFLGGADNVRSSRLASHVHDH